MLAGSKWLFFLFALMQKETKNQGKHDRSARFSRLARGESQWIDILSEADVCHCAKLGAFYFLFPKQKSGIFACVCRQTGCFTVIRGLTYGADRYVLNKDYSFTCHFFS